MRPMSRFIPAAQAAAWLATAVLLAQPLFSQAADMAWTATRTSFAALGEGRTTGKGTAVFTNGDKADTTNNCAVTGKDAKGWVLLKCDSQLRFADGSAITMAVDNGYDEKTLDARATATITGGSGRFAGITGSAAGIGLQGRMEWKANYSLPAKK